MPESAYNTNDYDGRYALGCQKPWSRLANLLKNGKVWYKNEIMES